MWQKAGAAAIVLAIGGIAAAVLYSPVETDQPGVDPVTLPLPAAFGLTAPRPSQSVTTRIPIAPAPRRAHLAGVAMVSYAGTPLPVRAFERPAAPAPRADTPAPLTAAAAMRSGALVPAVVGDVPHRAPAKAALGGAMRTAGESVGSAFAVTGRGLRAAFKRAF